MLEDSTITGDIVVILSGIQYLSIHSFFVVCFVEEWVPGTPKWPCSTKGLNHGPLTQHS